MWKMQFDQIWEADFEPMENQVKYQNLYFQYRRQMEELLDEYSYIGKEPRSFCKFSSLINRNRSGRIFCEIKNGFCQKSKIRKIENLNLNFVKNPNYPENRISTNKKAFCIF